MPRAENHSKIQGSLGQGTMQSPRVSPKSKIIVKDKEENSMFSMQEIGKRILKLRKERNMTQVDLADRLGISYQAVSSWERGNSMPDIAKIPELAELFQVSIDELIGPSKVVNAVLNTDAEQWKDEHFAEEEIEEAIPILKPVQITELIGSMDKAVVKDIRAFLPYMNEEDIKELAQEALHAGKSINEYLPFLNEEDIKDFAQETLRAGKGINEYLPFLEEEDIKEFAQETLRAGKGIIEYLPFLNEQDIKEFATEALRAGKSINEYLPFLNEEDIKEFAQETLRAGKGITGYLPFLNEEDVKELAVEALGVGQRIEE